MKIRELLDQKSAKVEEARALNEKAEAESRDLTADENTQWAKLQGEIEALDNRIERARTLPAPEPQVPTQAPAVIETRGDNFEKMFKAYLRDNDISSELRQFMGGDGVTFRASNNTDMNITTAADGGYAVPTGFYNQVIAKRSEISLPERLGVRRIPGIGTTVNVPYDNETDGEFISTSEAGTFDQDAPAIGQAAMTLVKYTKYITLSVELLNDEDAGLMPFLADWVSRGQAKTMNNLLLTEVNTNGTSFKTFAATNSIAAGEVESIYMNDTVADYLDDAGSVAWVMKASTFGSIISLTGNSRLYLPQVQGGTSPFNLLGYPAFFSTKAGSVATSGKSVYFGNWNFVGWREAPGFTMLRDPYSAASTGQVKLWMYFRTVFKVLQPSAIGYGVQSS